MTSHHEPAIRGARPADWLAIRNLLVAAGLPVEDLGPDRLGAFLVVETDDAVNGLIGLEGFGSVGLLRSLVVNSDLRGAGLGSSLVFALEAAASAAGIHELWLLTINSERFFERHGFAPVEREDVPDVIRRTDEFASLCPGTALVMQKSLLAAEGGRPGA